MPMACTRELGPRVVVTLSSLDSPSISIRNGIFKALEKEGVNINRNYP